MTGTSYEKSIIQFIRNMKEQLKQFRYTVGEGITKLCYYGHIVSQLPISLKAT